MSTNVQTIKLSDGREVLLSYGVPVAAFIPQQTPGDPIFGYIRRDESFSVTTSRHANAFAGKDSPRVASPEFLTLIAPVADAGRGRR
jgi:hypothetical protein